MFWYQSHQILLWTELAEHLLKTSHLQSKWVIKMSILKTITSFASWAWISESGEKIIFLQFSEASIRLGQFLFHLLSEIMGKTEITSLMDKTGLGKTATGLGPLEATEQNFGLANSKVSLHLHSNASFCLQLCFHSSSNLSSKWRNLINN